MLHFLFQRSHGIFRMAFYYLWKSKSESLHMLPEQEMRHFLQRFGCRKSISLDISDVSDVHCGTDYRCLSPWMAKQNVSADNAALKDFWKKDGSSNCYKYVFVFHECDIPNDATEQQLSKKIVGCSFHPPVFRLLQS